jgi:ubiquinol-cytochrome c reductase cytochrome b subunit
VASPTARKDKLRARLSRFYFTDRVEPVTPTELAAAHHDGHGHEAIEAGEERPELEPSER